MAPTICEIIPASVAGKAATAEAKAKLNLIAQHQEISPRAEQVKEPKISPLLKVSLEDFMYAVYTFTAPAGLLLQDDEVEDYAEWVRDIAIYAAKTLCTASQSVIGKELGLGLQTENVKSKVKGIERRIARKISKDQKRGNNDLVLLLNDFRLHVMGA